MCCSRVEACLLKESEHGLHCYCCVIAPGLMCVFLFVPVVWDEAIRGGGDLINAQWKALVPEGCRLGSESLESEGHSRYRGWKARLQSSMTDWSQRARHQRNAGDRNMRGQM